MQCNISIAPILFLIRRRSRLCIAVMFSGAVGQEGRGWARGLRARFFLVSFFSFLQDGGLRGNSWRLDERMIIRGKRQHMWTRRHYHFLLFQSYPKLIPADVNTDDLGLFETSPSARLHQSHNNLYCITVIPPIKTNHLRLIDRLYNNLWTWYRGTDEGEGLPRLPPPPPMPSQVTPSGGRARRLISSGLSPWQRVIAAVRL